MASAAGAAAPPPAGMGPPRPHAAPDSRHRQAPPQQQQQHHHHHHRQRPQQGHAAAAAAPRPPAKHHSSRPAGHGQPAAGGSGSGGPPIPAIAVDGTAELERLRRDTPFMCNIRFKNDLPEIPADPKLLVSRFEPERLSQFFVTSIEQQPRRELLLPADVGVPISLLDLERYDVPAGLPERPKLDPADAALLQDADTLAVGGQNVSPLKVKRATKGQVSWLMATTYLTSSGVGKRGEAPGNSSRFQMAQQPQELTRDQQLADIEATFTAASAEPRHPTKPHLHAVSSVPIFPDFDKWVDKFVTVHFDEGDPAQDSKTLGEVTDPKLRHQLVSRCMIKSYQPQSGSEPAMGLLVPRAAAAAAAAGSADAEALAEGAEVAELEGDYSWDCEYSFDLVTREGNRPPDTLLLFINDDNVGYCQLDGQVKLRKRKRQDGDEPRPEKAVISHRDFRDAELAERANRTTELEQEMAEFGAGEEEGLEGAEPEEADY